MKKSVNSPRPGSVNIFFNPTSSSKCLETKFVFRKICVSDVSKIAQKFGNYIIRYKCLHFGDNCFSLGTFYNNEPIGIISAYPKPYPRPLNNRKDAFIDVLDVDTNFRRQGIARELIRITEEWAKVYGYSQIRAWSSEDKPEAIQMWYNLGYCMCPAKIHLEWREEDINGFYVAKKLNPVI